MTGRVINIGTRASHLALTQTRWVMNLLQTAHPNFRFAIVEITSQGDRDRATSLRAIGGQGLFTKALEDALRQKQIDIAVHSAKDLPSVMIPELTLAAVPERESPADCWLSRDGKDFGSIAKGATVGTGSPRRQAQVKHLRPDLQVKDIRGNIETRLRKLSDGDYDALIMAHAGLRRGGYEDRITSLLDTDTFLPAPGQGALAVQTRANDDELIKLIQTIDHAPSHRCLDIERAVLASLKAGCSTPIGGLATIRNDKIALSAVVLDNEGTTALRAKAERALTENKDDALVQDVVEQLLAQGADKLIAGHHES